MVPVIVDVTLILFNKLYKHYPKAREISLPLNHLLTMAADVTKQISAPNPNKILP